MSEQTAVPKELNDPTKKQVKQMGQDLKESGVKDFNNVGYDEAHNKSPQSTPSPNDRIGITR